MQNNLNKYKKGPRQLSLPRLLITATFLVFTIYIISMYFSSMKTISKSQFMVNVNNGEYTKIVADVGNSATTVNAFKKSGSNDTVTLYNEEFQKILESGNGVKEIAQLREKTDDGLSKTLVFGIIGMGLLLGIILYTFIKNVATGPKGQLEFGKSKAKLYEEGGKKVLFSDVAGSNEEKESLEEIVDYLKNPNKYTEMGARIPKGVLLVGPPGTGKTLLARAVAGEANVPFYTISGSDFLEMFVGVGASRVRDLFDKAKKTAPSIIFIDEIDAIGRARGAGFGGGHDEREQTLNQILVEMDGFEGNTGVIMMAATNRPDILDPALLRPGRFDRRIRINPPNSKERVEILKIHTRQKPLSDDVDLNIIARSTIGFTGAELENLANEAALIAVKQNRKYITNLDFENARNIIAFGPEKRNTPITEKAKKLTAYHEAGHAIVSKYFPEYWPVTEISIVPRGGGAGGYTLFVPPEERDYVAKQDFIDEISTLLGGRCAEHLILNDISTGAKSDIDRASSIARAMVCEYGMSDKIGNVTFPESEEVFMARDMSRRPISNDMSNLIDSEVKRIIDTAYDKSLEILKSNEEVLHRIAKNLLDREILKGYEFEYLLTHETLKEDFTPEEIEELNKALYKKTTQTK